MQLDYPIFEDALARYLLCVLREIANVFGNFMQVLPEYG